jgi:putative flippase GtrA
VRPLRFGTVGGITAGLQVGLLWLFKSGGLDSVVAYAIALALAVQFNFLANHAFVWGDRRVAGRGIVGLAERWLTFHSCIALSIVINMGVFVVAHLAMPDLVAAALAIALSTVVKFLSLDRLAFRAAAPLEASKRKAVP